MKKLILSVLVCLAASTSHAADWRVVELPETSGRWYLTLVYGDDYQQNKELFDLFKSDPVMSGVASRTIFNTWESDNGHLNTEKWRNFLGDARPAVLLQAPPGHGDTKNRGPVVFYQAGDIDLETLPDRLYARVERHAQGCNLCRPRKPARPTTPEVEPRIEQIVPTDETEPEPENSIPLWLVFLPAGAAGLRILQEFKKAAKEEKESL